MLSGPELQSVDTAIKIPGLPPRYILIGALGHGSTGVVYEGFDKKTNKKVAIKHLKDIFRSVEHASRLLREVKLLRFLQGHPNIIGLEDFILLFESADADTFNEMVLIFECADTSLQQVIYSPQVLGPDHIQYFIYQMLCGLNFMNSAHLLHRDIKPGNLLVNAAQCELKIADFGLARSVAIPEAFVKKTMEDQPAKKYKKPVRRTKKSKEDSIPRPAPLVRALTQHVVTRWYRAPEQCLHLPYDERADLWAVGCILGELINRKPLFPGVESFPVSAKAETQKDKYDQLNKIFDVIGTPSEEDLAAIENPKIRDYVASFKKRPHQHFRNVFPTASPMAIDLLKKILVFNPAKRISVLEALNHPFLESYRNETMSLGFPLQPSQFIVDDKLTEDADSIIDYFRFERDLEKSKIASKDSKEQKAAHAGIVSESKDESSTAVSKESIRLNMLSEFQRYHGVGTRFVKEEKQDKDQGAPIKAKSSTQTVMVAVSVQTLDADKEKVPAPEPVPAVSSPSSSFSFKTFMSGLLFGDSENPASLDAAGKDKSKKTEEEQSFDLTIW